MTDVNGSLKEPQSVEGSLLYRLSIYLLRLAFAVLGVLALVSVSTAYAASTANVVPTDAEKVTVAITDAKTITFSRPVEHVAAYWHGGTDAHVTLAFSSDGTNFGAPIDAGRDDAGQELRDGMTYGAVRVADGAIAVRVTTDVPLAQFNLVGMSSGEGVAPLLISAEAFDVAEADQPTIIPRAGWSANPSYLNWAPEFYPSQKVIVHHTGENINYNENQHYYAKLVRSIYYYHAVTQGWGDIAYNFLIDPLGTIYEGRYSDNDDSSPYGGDVYGNGVTGGHTYGYNTGTVGIAVLGTYSNRYVSSAARASLITLIAWIAQKNGIDPTGADPYYNPFNTNSTIQTQNIAGHLDYRSTDCPGATFYGTLPTIRQEVWALTGAVVEPMPSPTYIELSASSSSPTVGQQVTLTARLIEESSRLPLAGQTVWFGVSGVAGDAAPLGTAVTDADGVASLQTTAPSVGPQWFSAGFDPATDVPYRGSTTSAEVNVGPGGLSAIPGNTLVQLWWTGAAEASSYNVYRDGVKVNSAPVTSASYVDTGLTNRATYSHQVTAIVNGRESAKSAAVNSTPTVGASIFTDVSSSPYQTAISIMAGLGIVSGYGNGTFGPDNLVLRKQFAKMIVGIMGLPVSEDDWQDANPPFTDCGNDDPASTYPHDFIAVAKAHGLTQGKTPTTFAPDANITRAQVATMVVRAALNSGIGLEPVGADYAGVFRGYNNATHGPNVRLAEYNGLLQGLVTSGPTSSWMDVNATRGEVCQILFNLMQITGG